MKLKLIIMYLFGLVALAGSTGCVIREQRGGEVDVYHRGGGGDYRNHDREFRYDGDRDQYYYRDRR
jgi:hypothetical protein